MIRWRTPWEVVKMEDVIVKALQSLMSPPEEKPQNSLLNIFGQQAGSSLSSPAADIGAALRVASQGGGIGWPVLLKACATSVLAGLLVSYMVSLSRKRSRENSLRELHYRDGSG